MAYEATGGAMQPSGMGGGALARAEDGGPPLAIRGSFWVRLLSVIIDGVILGIVGGIIGGVLAVLAGERAMNAGQGLGGLIGLLYYLYFWSQRGQTPGGMVMNLRLVNAAGENPSLGSVVIRYFAQILSTIPFFLGYLWAFGEKRRTWHDMLAGTWVIKTNQ